MLNINNISVKDQRLKDHNSPISYLKKLYNNLVAQSREKNVGLTEPSFLRVQIRKSNQSIGKTKGEVINGILST
jgi:hypothetical protein